MVRILFLNGLTANECYSLLGQYGLTDPEEMATYIQCHVKVEEEDFGEDTENLAEAAVLDAMRVSEDDIRAALESRPKLSLRRVQSERVLYERLLWQ